MAESFTNQAREQAESKSSFFKREKILGAFRSRRSNITGVKFKKGTSQESIGNIEGRVSANEKKITLLKNIVKLRKQNVDKNQMGSPLLESLKSIASTTDSIRNSLIEQQDRDEGAAEEARLQREKEEREKQEKGLEKKPSMVEKMAAPILKPVMSLWEKIWKFISTLFLGKLLMNFLDWVGNPANQDKIKTFVRFIKDWWPALTTAVLLFGTGFGSLVAGLAKSIAWFIPAMASALAKLKAAKWMSALSMFPVGGKVAAVAKGATLIGGGLLIGSQMGKDSAPETEITGLNKGGQVPGSGPNKDTVPAMLTPGEFVMSRGAVEKYGVNTLEGMNAAAGGTNLPTFKRVEVPHYNEGGMIMQQDLVEVNKERALQGLPPLEQLMGYDNLPKAKGPGERSNESTNISTNLENMMRTVTKTVNGETTTKTYKLSNEEAEALLKKKGYPSMKLADGSVVIDSASYMFDKSVEMLRNAYENGDPQKIAQLNADPDFIEMWKAIEDGSLRKEVISNARMHKKGTKENLMQKNMNRIEQMDGGEGIKLMNFNGGGLVQGLQGGGLVEEHNRLRMLRNRIKVGPDGKWSKEDKKKRDQLSSQMREIRDQIIAQNASQKSTPTTQTPVNDKKSRRGKSGIGRLIGGTADQLTGNLFDFDKRSGGGLIRKTASALGGLFGGGKKDKSGSTSGSTRRRLKDRPQVQALRDQAKPFMNQGKVTLSSNNASGTPQAAPSSGILGPISSNVDVMVNRDKYEVKPKEKKNVIIALEQEANQNGSEIQQQQPAGNEIPAFDVAPIRDPLKMEILDIVVF